MRIRIHTLWILSLQLLLIFLSLVLAWLLRFEFKLPQINVLLAAFPVLAVVRLGALFEFKLLHGYWRYTGASDAQDVLKAIAIGSVVFYLIERWVLGVTAFPSSVYIVEAMLSAAFLGAIRFLSRSALQAIERGHVPLSKHSAVIIVGAGAAGVTLVRALPRTAFMAVGFVDDDPAKAGARLCGVPVLGTLDTLPRHAQRRGIDEVLIAIPSATGEQMRHIVDLCHEARVPYRTIPNYVELIDKNITADQLREVRFEDLLGREAVHLAAAPAQEKLAGKVVVVTGAAGSIGSELCSQLRANRPAKLICVDQDESGLFFLQQRLEQEHLEVKTEYRVADISNRLRMTQILIGQNAEIIFHAAAYKHVPLMEANVGEAVSNNVFGLIALLDVARECGCRSFVAISSDKAVNPTSVMGCTKRIGELILAARPHGEMRCISVRFGNVLGSQGSVVPLFEEQIRKHGKVTVTHPDVTRFFMTISEAVSLVLQGFALGRHGEILVLEMGEPMRIVDMVRMLTRLLGKKDDEVEITFTGLREGEKLYEELFYSSEVPLPTECGKVMRARGKLVSWDVLKGGLNELRALIGASTDDATLRLRLSQIVPEFRRNQGLPQTSFATTKPVRTLAVPSKEPVNVGNSKAGRVSELGALS